MNALLEQLHDIEGIDPINWWNLPIGWWVVIGVGALIVCAMICYVICRIAFKRSWKGYTLQKLTDLETNLSEKTARETVITLSEYLRRIALRRFSRKECAALMGKAWLKWLRTNDPKQFDWEKKGSLLIEIPYAPLDAHLPSDQIKDLIQAVKSWVR